MRTCPAFRKFIDIESNFPQSVFYQPTRIGTIRDFSKGVRDFIYLPQYNTGFIAQSDMNLVTRMDSYFTNVSLIFIFLTTIFLQMTMPWEKKQKKTSNSVLTEEAVATVGAL